MDRPIFFLHVQYALQYSRYSTYRASYRYIGTVPTEGTVGSLPHNKSIPWSPAVRVRLVNFNNITEEFRKEFHKGIHRWQGWNALVWNKLDQLGVGVSCPPPLLPPDSQQGRGPLGFSRNSMIDSYVNLITSMSSETT